MSQNNPRKARQNDRRQQGRNNPPPQGQNDPPQRGRHHGPAPPRPWQPLAHLGTHHGPDGRVSRFANDAYRVDAALYGNWTLLLITPQQASVRAQVQNVTDLQHIKADLLGEEREAVQILPAKSRQPENALPYRVWVLNEGRLPVSR